MHLHVDSHRSLLKTFSDFLNQVSALNWACKKNFLFLFHEQLYTFLKLPYKDTKKILIIDKIMNVLKLHPDQ